MVEQGRPSQGDLGMLIGFTHVPWSKVTFFGDGHPTFSRNPYNGYINPYYRVDDHPLLYGDNGSLDPSTHQEVMFASQVFPR